MDNYTTEFCWVFFNTVTLSKRNIYSGEFSVRVLSTQKLCTVLFHDAVLVKFSNVSWASSSNNSLRYVKKKKKKMFSSFPHMLALN